MSIAITVRPGLPSTDGEFYFDPSTFGPQLAALEGAGATSIAVDSAGGLLANLDLTAFVGRATSSASIEAGHWAGVIQPQVAAAQLAFLDQRLGGRLALHISMDGAGSRGLHEASCRRTDEYLTLLKRLWSNDRPIHHEGEFYSLVGGFVTDKGPQGWEIPIRMNARTGSAIRVAARHATQFDVDADDLRSAAATINALRAAAGSTGRRSAITFSAIVRVQSLPSDHLARPALAARAVVRRLRHLTDLGVSGVTLVGVVDPVLVSALRDALAAAIGGREPEVPAVEFAKAARAALAIARAH
jgi:alkanesulfonate monooxygenase